MIGNFVKGLLTGTLLSWLALGALSLMTTEPRPPAQTRPAETTPGAFPVPHEDDRRDTVHTLQEADTKPAQPPVVRDTDAVLSPPEAVEETASQPPATTADAAEQATTPLPTVTQTAPPAPATGLTDPDAVTPPGAAGQAPDAPQSLGVGQGPAVIDAPAQPNAPGADDQSSGFGG